MYIRHKSVCLFDEDINRVQSQSHDSTAISEILILLILLIDDEDFLNRLKTDTFHALLFPDILGCDSLLTEHPLRLSL